MCAFLRSPYQAVPPGPRERHIFQRDQGWVGQGGTPEPLHDAGCVGCVYVVRRRCGPEPCFRLEQGDVHQVVLQQHQQGRTHDAHRVAARTDQLRKSLLAASHQLVAHHLQHT